MSDSPKITLSRSPTSSVQDVPSNATCNTTSVECKSTFNEGTQTDQQLPPKLSEEDLRNGTSGIALVGGKARKEGTQNQQLSPKSSAQDPNNGASDIAPVESKTVRNEGTQTHDLSPKSSVQDLSNETNDNSLVDGRKEETQNQQLSPKLSTQDLNNEASDIAPVESKIVRNEGTQTHEQLSLISSVQDLINGTSDIAPVEGEVVRKEGTEIPQQLSPRSSAQDLSKWTNTIANAEDKNVRNEGTQTHQQLSPRSSDQDLSNDSGDTVSTEDKYLRNEETQSHQELSQNSQTRPHCNKLTTQNLAGIPRLQGTPSSSKTPVINPNNLNIASFSVNESESPNNSTCPEGSLVSPSKSFAAKGRTSNLRNIPVAIVRPQIIHQPNRGSFISDSYLSAGNANSSNIYRGANPELRGINSRQVYPQSLRNIVGHSLNNQGALNHSVSQIPVTNISITQSAGQQSLPFDANPPAQIAHFEKMRWIQNHLVLILHAHTCLKRESQSNPCLLPHCLQMKIVLNHMLACQIGESCPRTFCASSRQIIEHWENCIREDCPICSPIKRHRDQNSSSRNNTL